MASPQLDTFHEPVAIELAVTVEPAAVGSASSYGQPHLTYVLCHKHVERHRALSARLLQRIERSSVADSEVPLIDEHDFFEAATDSLTLR
jgi:hypothetical protein